MARAVLAGIGLRKDNAWEVERNDPVRLVDDLADAQVSAHGAEHVGVLGREPARGAQKVDHAGKGGASAFHEVRADTCRHLVAVGIQMACYRSPRGEARHGEVCVLHHVQLHRHVHLALDGRAAHLAVALCRMRVADREQRAFHLDRQIERGARSQIPDIEIAADPAWRHHRMQTRFRRRKTDRAGKRFQRHTTVLAEGCRLKARRIVVPKRQRRLLELVRQKAEARNVRRPAEAGRFERKDLDLQRVARLGAFHIDGTIDRIDLREVQRGDVVHGAVSVEPGVTLAAGGIERSHPK
ncbi:hypothetical protein KSW81_003254 [Nannochloris sp. 'desiccata']|nr:hypothetical protein KSW81_003254 [Chlorella desiccata (nom. nud.)]